APGLLDDIVRSLDEALVALDGAQAAAEEAMRRAEFDPQALERAEERLFSLRALARKHNVAVDDLARLRDEMEADLADLDAGEGRLAALGKEAEAARAAYDSAAATLSGLRRAAADALARAVAAELPALKLERA